MKCPNCGAKINKESVCPDCGINLAPYIRARAISARFYNRALEMAHDSDLSGAISELKKSIAFNKNNINARNLLGLVYSETGDIASALKQWVLSINIQQEKNLAADFLASYEKDTRRAEQLEQSIKLYNEALSDIRDRNDDMAIISLKKALNLNPRFIEANNMLALCYLMRGKNSQAVDLINTVLKQDINNDKALRYYRGLYPDKSRPVPKGYRSDPRNSAYYMPQTVARNSRANSKRTQPVIPMFFFGFISAAIIVSLLAIPQIIEKKQNELNMQAAKYNELKQSFDELSTKYNESSASLSQEQKTQSKMSLQDRVKQINTAETLYNSDNATEAAMILVNIDTTDFSPEIMEQYSKQKQLILPLAAEQFYTGGRQQVENNDIETAKTLFNQCLKCCQEGDEIRYSALYQLGKIAITENDEQTAAECFQQVAENHPVQSVKNEAKRYLEGKNA